MAERSQLTSHKKQIEQDVSSDMPPTSSVETEEGHLARNVLLDPVIVVV